MLYFMVLCFINVCYAMEPVELAPVKSPVVLWQVKNYIQDPINISPIIQMGSHLCSYLAHTAESRNFSECKVDIPPKSPPSGNNPIVSRYNFMLENAQHPEILPLKIVLTREQWPNEKRREIEHVFIRGNKRVGLREKSTECQYWPGEMLRLIIFVHKPDLTKTAINLYTTEH